MTLLFSRKQGLYKKKENFDIFFELCTICPIGMNANSKTKKKPNEKETNRIIRIYLLVLISFFSRSILRIDGLIYSTDLIYSVNPSWIHF